jgi:signal transduction histidine kinase
LETLVFIAGLQQGKRFVIEKDLVRMGRERFNDITIDDESSSRAHAEIRRHREGLRLKDLGSTNGTYVNSRRVTEVALKDGDRISIGGTVILVEIERKPDDAAQQSVLFREGRPAEVTTQFRLDPSGKDFLSPARMRVDVRAQENFRRLYNFMIRAAGQLTVSNLLDSVMEEVMNATGADRGFILLAEGDGALKPVHVRKRADRAVVVTASEISVSKSLSRHVLEKGESLMLTEVREDGRFADTTAFGAGEVTAVIAAPLKVHDKVAGLVYIDCLQGGRALTQADQELVTVMSLVAAAVLENVRLYEQFMAATEYSAAILRSLSSGLMVVDSDLAVRKVNQAALRMLESEEMEVVGRRLDAIPGVAEMAAVMRKALDKKTPVDRAEVEIRLGEKGRPVGLSVSFMCGHGGEIQGAVANFRDLSMVRKLAEQVKRQEQLAALGEMAAGVAHEIRNPLNSIRGFAQLMAEGGDSSAGKEADFLRIIIEEVDRMNGIVQDLLDFARQRQMTMTRLALGDLLDGVLTQVRGEAGGLGIEVAARVDPDLPRAYGNGDKLRQVFLNICRNALQAMGSGGRLTVVAALEAPAREGDGPRELRVSFSDTGPGIPAEILPRIFDPFFTTKDVGTGLGLAISAKVVHAHSGRIEVESPPGTGATFTVFLPAPAQGETDRFPPVA